TLALAGAAVVPSPISATRATAAARRETERFLTRSLPMGPVGQGSLAHRWCERMGRRFQSDLSRRSAPGPQILRTGRVPPTDPNGRTGGEGRAIRAQAPDQGKRTFASPVGAVPGRP